MGNFEALSGERVANFLDAIANSALIPKHDDVDNALLLQMSRQLWDMVVDLRMHEGLSFCGSENESSETVQVLHLNNTSNRLQIALDFVAHKTSTSLLIILFTDSLQAIV